MKKILITTAILALIGLTIAPAALAQTISYVGYNVAPTWNNRQTTFSVVQGQTLSVTVDATDNNNEALTYASVRLPSNASFDVNNHVLNFTPDYTQLGSFSVVLSVTDSHSTPVNKTFYVNVMSAGNSYVYRDAFGDSFDNAAPYFISTQSYYTINSGSSLTFTVRAADPDDNAVRFTASNLPSGASFNGSNGQFSWTPASGSRGVYGIQFYATDGRATSEPLAVTIVVDGGSSTRVVLDASGATLASYTAGIYSVYGTQSNSTRAPYFTTTPVTTVYPGQTYIYDANAVSPSGAQISYSLTAAPSGSYVNNQSGRVSWVVPTNVYNGQQFSFILVASNGSTSATQGFTLTVSGARTASSNIQYVYTQPKTTYVAAPVQQVATTPSFVETSAGKQNIQPIYSGNYAVYYPGETVVINTGRTIPTLPVISASYGTSYAANVYDTMGVNALHAFNLAVRAGEKGDMIIRWDTNRASKAEVVYGYVSHARTDAWNMILNYDFTTGEMETVSTKHEVSLGKLQIGRTYYLRIISRDNAQTDISREITFIPMATDQGPAVVQGEGAASAASTVGGFFTSNGFLGFVGLAVLALLGYVIYLGFAGGKTAGDSLVMPELQLYDTHDTNGHAPVSGNGHLANGHDTTHH